MRWLPLLLIAAGFVAYANSFTGPFVLDDRSSIVDNPTIRSLWPLSRALNGPAQLPTAGRPLINLSLAINYAAGGLSPAGYHAWNLAVHISCALLLFGIVKRTLQRMADLKVRTTTATADLKAHTTTATTDLKVRTTDWYVVQAFRPALVAFAIALIWLVHPLQSEVVDYVTQRTESMMALFYLSTLYCAIRGFSAATSSRRWLALSVLSCAVGMTCKESMATAPIMVLLYDRVFAADSFRTAITKRRWFYAGLTLAWFVLLALTFSGPRFRSAGFSSGISPLTYLMNQAVLVVRYLRLAFWPAGFVIDYGVPRALTLGDVWPYALFIALLLVATIALWRRHQPAAFLGTWFFVTLAPTSSLVPIATEVGAERRMYLPMCALVTFVIVGAIYLWNRFFAETSRQWAVRTAAAVLTVISVALVTLTIRRNAEYRADPISMWRTVIGRYPHSRVHYNLGVVLYDAGQRDAALREYEAAGPDFPDVEYAFGVDSFEQKRYDQAIAHLRRYIELQPDAANVVRAWVMLGRALSVTGKTTEAVEAFRRVVQMQPRNIDAIGGLADALLRLERLDEAAAAYQQYIRLAPSNAGVFFNLGLILSRLGRHEESVAAFANAVALSPREPAFHANLANALVAVGRPAEAIEHFRQARQFESDPQTRAELSAIIDQLTTPVGAR